MTPDDTNEILNVAAQLIRQAIYEDGKNNQMLAQAMRHWAMRLRRAIDGKSGAQS